MCGLGREWIRRERSGEESTIRTHHGWWLLDKGWVGEKEVSRRRRMVDDVASHRYVGYFFFCVGVCVWGGEWCGPVKEFKVVHQ